MNVLLFARVGLAAGAVGTRRFAVPARSAHALGVLGAILGGFLLSAVAPVFQGPIGSILAAAAGALLVLLLVRPFYSTRPGA